jgi:hypothetical protein
MATFNFTSILCFDGTTPPVDPQAAPVAPQAPQAPPAPPADPAPPEPPATPGSAKMFSQDDLNKILAEDKRKHQERYGQLEAEHKELLANVNLTQEDRDKLKMRITDLQKAQLTEKQQIEFERKQAEEKYQTELDIATKRAEHWESLHKKETVSRALQDAASSADAFNDAQVVALLKPDTELKDVDGVLTPMVNFNDVDEKTGGPVQTLCTPADAVKRMQQLPKIYGNLFRSNVVSGVGAGQGQGITQDSYDYENISPEQYRQNRQAIKDQVSGR